MTATMGDNRYGKSGIRLATVQRDGDTHTFVDLEIEIRLAGDFDPVHVDGDNSPVVPTDTMRGTCYGLARDGIDSPAAFARRLATRLLAASPAAGRVWVRIFSFPWERVEVDGAPHPHTFRPAAGGESVVTLVQDRGADPVVMGGVRGARVLKTTGSAFSDFRSDEYTTLPPVRDRIMATTMDATWGTTPDADHEGLARAVPATALARFATHDDSESVQHTLYAMGQAVIEAHPEVTWIRFVLPNEHHILVDLAPYGLDNPGEVFLVGDRPYGVIEGTVVREGHAPEVGW
ncbi:MAG: urate oxidase [Egicoccus sp.]